MNIPVLVPCSWDSANQLQTGGSKGPYLGFHYFVRVADRTQRNMLLIRLLVYYKRNSQMEETHKARYWERAGASMPSQSTTLLKSPCIHPSGSSLNLAVGFYGTSIM